MGLKPYIAERQLITDRNYRFEFGQAAGMTIDEIIADPQQRGLLLWAQKKLEDFDLSYELLEEVELDSNNHRSYWDLQTYWICFEKRKGESPKWDLMMLAEAGGASSS